MRYNFIYDKLVQNRNDLIGIIAYGIYKQHKIEFITGIKESKNREPNEEECNAFFVTTTTDSQLGKYRNDAEILLTEVVLRTAEEEINAREREILLDYKKNIKEALPSNFKTIALSVASSFIFSVILAIFFILGMTSEKEIKDVAEKAVTTVIQQQGIIADSVQVQK